MRSVCDTRRSTKSGPGRCKSFFEKPFATYVNSASASGPRTSYFFVLSTVLMRSSFHVREKDRDEDSLAETQTPSPPGPLFPQANAAFAARRPLRTALSMVAGSPVLV